MGWMQASSVAAHVSILTTCRSQGSSLRLSCDHLKCFRLTEYREVQRVTGESRKGEGDMWTTACRKRIHRFKTVRLHIYTTQIVVFLLFRICVNSCMLILPIISRYREYIHFVPVLKVISRYREYIHCVLAVISRYREYIRCVLVFSVISR